MTAIAPGYVDSDLKYGTTSAVARATACAIEQPADSDINEIVLRPTAQDF